MYLLTVLKIANSLVPNLFRSWLSMKLSTHVCKFYDVSTCGEIYIGLQDSSLLPWGREWKCTYNSYNVQEAIIYWRIRANATVYMAFQQIIILHSCPCAFCAPAFVLVQDGNFSTSWTCTGDPAPTLYYTCALNFRLYYYRHLKHVRIGKWTTGNKARKAILWTNCISSTYSLLSPSPRKSYKLTWLYWWACFVVIGINPRDKTFLYRRMHVWRRFLSLRTSDSTGSKTEVLGLLACNAK